MNHDLIIIGSGSVGSAAGYYASQAGLKILMIDSGHPPHSQGSYHGDTRLIRHAYAEGSKYVPLVQRAQKLWNELAETSGKKLFNRSGVITLGPAECLPLRNIAISAEKFSLPIEQMNAAAITARWPEIVVPEDYIGMFESNAGVLKSELAVETYISLAKKNGSEQLFNCKVTDIRHSEESVIVVTDNGEYQASKLLVSAGTWVTKLLPELPVTALRKTFAWHQADSSKYSYNNKFPGVTVVTRNGDVFCAFPMQDNEMKLCKHNGGKPIDAPEQCKPFSTVPSDHTVLVPFLREFLPSIGNCLRGISCTYGMTPDHDFIIDTLPGHDNTLVIAGLSGHGFKFSSVLGEIACRFALGQKPAFDLLPFALSRFKKV